MVSSAGAPEQGQSGPGPGHHHPTLAAGSSPGSDRSRPRPPAPPARGTPGSRRRRVPLRDGRDRERGDAQLAHELRTGSDHDERRRSLVLEQASGRRAPELAGRGDHDRGRGIGGGVLEGSRGADHVDLDALLVEHPGQRLGTLPVGVARVERRGVRLVVAPDPGRCEDGDHRHHDDQRRSPGASPASSSGPASASSRSSTSCASSGRAGWWPYSVASKRSALRPTRPPWVGYDVARLAATSWAVAPGWSLEPAALDLANGERPERVDQGVGVAALGERGLRPPPQLVGRGAVAGQHGLGADPGATVTTYAGQQEREPHDQGRRDQHRDEGGDAVAARRGAHAVLRWRQSQSIRRWRRCCRWYSPWSSSSRSSRRPSSPEGCRGGPGASISRAGPRPGRAARRRRPPCGSAGRCTAGPTRRP